MFLALSTSALGLKDIPLTDALTLAAHCDYEGLEIDIHQAAEAVEAHGADALLEKFRAHEMRIAGWQLPVKLYGDDAEFERSILALPRLAAAAEKLEARRAFTWILPYSDTMEWSENYHYHLSRLRLVWQTLNSHGIRLGLEFVGVPSMREGHRYPFIHNQQQMLELCSDLGQGVGLLIDSFHWHASGGTVKDLLSLKSEQVIYAHINDAPDVPLSRLLDNRRCLPGITGVIDLYGFLNALNAIGYDGPVVAEPFGNPALWVADAMYKVFERAGV
jgi:sugar phosphate isomerase/epimerase